MLRRCLMSAAMALGAGGPLAAQGLQSDLARAGWAIVADQLPAPVRYLLPEGVLPDGTAQLTTELDALGRALGVRLDRMATAQDVETAIARGLAAQELIRAARQIEAVRLRLAACPEGDKVCAARLAGESEALLRIASEVAVTAPTPEVVALVLLAAETQGQILDRMGADPAVRAAEMGRYEVFFGNLASRDPGSPYGRALAEAKGRLGPLYGLAVEAAPIAVGRPAGEMLRGGLRDRFEAVMSASVAAVYGDVRLGYLDTVPAGEARYFTFGCVVRHAPRVQVAAPGMGLDGYMALLDRRLPPQEPIEGRAALTFVALGIEGLDRAPRAVARIVQAEGPDGIAMDLPLTSAQEGLILTPVPPEAQIGGRTTWGLVIEALTRPGDNRCVTADAFDLAAGEGLALLVGEVERRMAGMLAVYTQVAELEEGRALAEGYLAALRG